MAADLKVDASKHERGPYATKRNKAAACVGRHYREEECVPSAHIVTCHCKFDMRHLLAVLVSLF
eukprot:1417555-Amphidinium_carterae.1